MSYTINNTTGSTLVTLKDGTIDTSTTDVSLFGKGYAGFGERLNENFIKLLENFANTTAPNQKIKGQLWYDATTNQLQVYTGSKWKPVGGSTTTVAQPTRDTARYRSLCGWKDSPYPIRWYQHHKRGIAIRTPFGSEHITGQSSRHSW